MIKTEERCRELYEYLWHEFQIWQLHAVGKLDRLFTIGLTLRSAKQHNNEPLFDALEDELNGISRLVESRFIGNTLSKIMLGVSSHKGE